IEYTAVSDFLPDRNYLLIVKDTAPWTRRIVSGTYRDIYRKDLLYVVHGMSLNTPVFNYESEESAPECVYLDVTERGPSYIRNLRINRKKSSFRTVLFDIEYAVDLRMSDVEIYTEKDESVYPGPDRAMFFSDCANLLVENVRIFNTYASDTSIYTHGYGIEMNNCYNSIFRNLTATDAGWGGVWYQ
ncbi:MAG: hypothetical protein LUF04_11210, partial [Bacteroides sp.]|nr:hypothetical protein [Bacteroides sp.]